MKVWGYKREPVVTELLESLGPCLCGLHCLFPGQVRSKTVYLELVVMSVVPSQQLGLLTGSILYETMTLLETQISH